MEACSVPEATIENTTAGGSKVTPPPGEVTHLASPMLLMHLLSTEIHWVSAMCQYGRGEGGGAVNTDQDTIPALREPTGRRDKPVSRNFQHRVVNSVIKDERGTVGIQERHSA